MFFFFFFFFSSRRRHTRYWRDWSSDVCSSDLRRNAARHVKRIKEGDKLAKQLRKEIHSLEVEKEEISQKLDSEKAKAVERLNDKLKYQKQYYEVNMNLEKQSVAYSAKVRTLEDG